ncbi:MAG: tetratricopeptide (TPR) repeat protein [Planctomycetota bacterium]|jgi:tetratricopeptide (TPR) repeat protein
MMKLHALLTAGLATAAIAPVALGADEIDTLEAALQATSRALDVVVGVERRVKEDPNGARALVVQVTEAPILDAHRRDDRLVTLRSEISLLRTELDQLELNAIASGVTPLMDPIAPMPGDSGQNSGSSTGPTNLAPVSTGMDDATRDALSRARAGATARTNGVETTPDPNAQPTSEAGGYSANPLLEARACYRAGRFAEGASLLKNASGADAIFWRARCNERLGQLDQAEEDLRQVLTMDPDGPLAGRAQQDLDFVKWKRGFLERMGDRK